MEPNMAKHPGIEGAPLLTVECMAHTQCTTTWAVALRVTSWIHRRHHTIKQPQTTLDPRKVITRTVRGVVPVRHVAGRGTMQDYHYEWIGYLCAMMDGLVVELQKKFRHGH